MALKEKPNFKVLVDVHKDSGVSMLPLHKLVGRVIEKIVVDEHCKITIYTDYGKELVITPEIEMAPIAIFKPFLKIEVNQTQ